MLIDVTYAGIARSRLFIFSSIAMWQTSYGVNFRTDSGSSGLVQRRFPSSSLSWYQGQRGAIFQQGVTMWKSTLHVVCWTLWSEWNVCIFEDKHTSIQQVKDSAINRLYRWLSHLPLFAGCDFAYWNFYWNALLFYFFLGELEGLYFSCFPPFFSNKI